VDLFDSESCVLGLMFLFHFLDKAKWLSGLVKWWS
jgi:hypothetical protein